MNGRVVRTRWQDQIEQSGLQEVLALAKQLKDSGLFTDRELSPLQAELKELALILASGLVETLADESAPAEVAAAAPAAPPQTAHAKRVRNKLRGLSKVL